MGSIRKMVKYWLMKSEPGCYSIDHLKQDKTTYWDGVRNYQARNMIQNDMSVGDQVLFYHSNATPSGIAGVATISKAPYPDFTAWDPSHEHFDPKTSKEKPTWWMVDIQYSEKFTHFLGLPTLHQIPELSQMMVLKKGSRLSVQPVTEQEFTTVLNWGRKPAK